VADEIAAGDAAPAEEPNFDQAFFLALAVKGKDAWNAWRRDPANKDVRVTFKGVDFSEAPRDQINFEGFEFGDRADFSRCKWRGGEWSEIRDDPNAFKPGRAFFIGAAFGDRASFGGAAFGDWASFGGAAFGDRASFDGAAFGDDANFSRAAFGDDANFSRAAFGACADFAFAAYGALADFYGAAFGRGADFIGTAFGQITTFIDATFERGAEFFGATFGMGTSFGRAVFDGDANFTGAAFGGWPTPHFGGIMGRLDVFEQTHFKGLAIFIGKSKQQLTRDLLPPHGMDKRTIIELEQRHDSLSLEDGTGPDRFLTVSFTNARFDGEADFSGRSFERDADFVGARFYSPPNFDGAANIARIDLTGAYISFVPPSSCFHWTKYTSIPIRLRAFRKIAEETKNHDLERDLYIEERKAERGVYWHQLVEELKKQPWTEKPLIASRLAVHVLWIIVMGAYWALADYGSSFVRPATWLVSSVWLFHFGYAAILAPLVPQAGTLDAAKYARAEWMVALGNAVPFVGPLTIDAEVKKILFCPGGDCPIPPDGYQLLVLSQNLLSIILVFFIGLALRNYFRIK
jgi:hypothetical protein